MTKRACQRFADANQAHIALDSHMSGTIMSNIRTVNKRAKRAIATTHARGKAAQTPPAEKAKPAKAAI